MASSHIQTFNTGEKQPDLCTRNKKIEQQMQRSLNTSIADIAVMKCETSSCMNSCTFKKYTPPKKKPIKKRCSNLQISPKLTP